MGKKAKPEINGTLCVCDTHLCNGESMEKMATAGNEPTTPDTITATTTSPSSALQTSDSRNLIVICVLAVSALITFSVNYEVNI